VHPGADRRDAGRPQGTGRLHRWRRESAQDWRDLLLDLKRRGLDVPPRLPSPTARSVLKAAGEVWPKTREQRCWVHKTAPFGWGVGFRARPTRCSARSCFDEMQNP